MRKEGLKFRGRASHYLYFPRKTMIVLTAPGSDVGLAELCLEGVSPEELGGKTIIIDVELASELSKPETQVLRREDLTQDEWDEIPQQELTASYRDQYD